MLPEVVALAVSGTSIVGVCAAIISLYLIYRWKMVSYSFAPWTRKRTVGIFYAFFGYLLVYALAFSLLIIGVQFPDLIADIILEVLIYSLVCGIAGTILCVPFIWACQPVEVSE